MMSDDNVWLALSDSLLDKLHKFQVRHCVHLNVRECAIKETIRSEVHDSFCIRAKVEYQ